MTLTITTNNVPREALYLFEIDPKDQQTVRNEFGYLTQDEIEEELFFKYRGEWYSMGDFLRIENDPEFNGWDAVNSYSYYAGLLIKLVKNVMGDYSVIVGRFCS